LPQCWLSAVFKGQAYSGDDPWFFTPYEIANTHRYQQQLGARLRHPLNPEDCSYGQKEFSALVLLVFMTGAEPQCCRLVQMGRGI